MELSEHLHPDPNGVTDLKSLALKYLQVENAADLELTGSGRAYMPRTSNHLPIVSKVAWDQLFPGHKMPVEHKTCGVFLDVRQYLDGFTLGPGSGKVMSELIRGEESSVDLAPFKSCER